MAMKIKMKNRINEPKFDDMSDREVTPEPQPISITNTNTKHKKTNMLNIFETANSMTLNEQKPKFDPMTGIHKTQLI